MTFLSVILGLCSVVIGVLLLRQLRADKIAHDDAKVLGEKLKVNLTHIRWYSELILEQDFGKLNFTQIEYLHQMNEACQKAIENLRALLHDEHLDLTFLDIGKTLAKKTCQTGATQMDGNP